MVMIKYMPHLMLELLGRLVDVSSWHVVSKTIAVPQTNIDRAKQGTTTLFFQRNDSQCLS